MNSLFNIRRFWWVVTLSNFTSVVGTTRKITECFFTPKRQIYPATTALVGNKLNLTFYSHLTSLCFQIRLKTTKSPQCRLTNRFLCVAHLNREERTLGTRLSIWTRTFLAHYTLTSIFARIILF